MIMVHKRIVFAVFLVIYLFNALALVPDIESMFSCFCSLFYHCCAHIYVISKHWYLFCVVLFISI